VAPSQGVTKKIWDSETWLSPLEAQIRGLRLDEATVSAIEEVVVRGEEFVSVRLTPEAYAHGLALALPAEVVVPALPTWGGPRHGSNMALARPTGLEPATFGSGTQRSIH
jgi:hypothetical protein